MVMANYICQTMPLCHVIWSVTSVITVQMTKGLSDAGTLKQL